LARGITLMENDDPAGWELVRHIAAVRAAMQRLFVGFHLGTSDLADELVDEPAPETDNLLDPVEVGAGLMVWAEVSPAAVLGIEDQAPILDRQPIHADDQNRSDVFPT
jgi:hypothetical protein